MRVLGNDLVFVHRDRWLHSRLEGQPFAELPPNAPVHSITVSATPLAGSTDAGLSLGYVFLWML